MQAQHGSLPKEVRGRRCWWSTTTPASLYATSRILRAAGFEVIEADSGGKALALADQVGLLVLDINLPDMDGFEVCRQLRARSSTAYLPIVHLSATFMDKEDMSQGLEAGADSYLTHPADPAVLVATVRALLFARQADVVKRAADARFRKIFELASGGIALLECGAGLSRSVIRRLQPWSGVTRRASSAARLVELAAPDQQAKLAMLRQELASQGVWAGLLTVTRADGGLADVEWQLAMESGGDSCIAIAVDVTARQRLEVEREAAAWQ